LIPAIAPQSAAWGDSMTFQATGVIEALLADPNIDLIRTFDDTVSRTEIIERRRRALLTDLFLSGTNAVTLSGKLT
jgi:hypothetical protein